MTRQKLHWLIALDVCLVLFALKLELSGISQIGLDQELADWLAKQEEQELTKNELIAGIVSLVLIMMLLFSWIWLWMLKPYSRIIYTVTSISGFFLLPILGVYITNGWPDLFDGLSSIVAGIIIGALYFSDVYPHRKQAQQATAPNP